MDCERMGSFLAQLRKEAGMTQAQLGERLGVTNKTVSRWECGNYLPDIAMFRQIAALFGVTVEDLLDGRRAERIPDRAAPPADDGSNEQPGWEPTAQKPVFSREEQIEFWKKKWLREHRGIHILLAVAYAAGFFLLAGRRQPVLIAILTLSVLGTVGSLRNRMLAYVEERVWCR